MCSQRYTDMMNACVCVCVSVAGVRVGVFVGVSYVCVWANVYACICHSRESKKIFLASKDKNKILK